MKIIIDRNCVSERQSAVVTVDTKHCHYPYAIREAIELAMELDGYTKETIDEVFGRRLAETCVKSEDCGGILAPQPIRITTVEKSKNV